MRVVAVLALLLFNVQLSASCYREGNVLFCSSIPTDFPSGPSTLLLSVKNVGVINSTVLHSDDLASFNRLSIRDAGVTGIAEGAFRSFRNLTSLTLDQNSLTEINPNWFSRPEILNAVTMTDNQIEVLNVSMLSRLTGLTKLSLNKNRIRTIDPNSFSSLTVLAELDLSDNQLTWVSPQVFRSLRSTRIALSGNPWNCSCEAEDFVDSIKDLQSRSLLDRPLQVTCESPPPLKGQPVWNVSMCVTSPPTRPLSVAPPVQPTTTDTFTTVPPSTGTTDVVTSSPSHLTSETETSVHPEPSDAPSSHIATPPAWSTSETKTSVQPKPTDILTTVLPSTDTSVTSPARLTSETLTSVQPEPIDTLTTTTTPTLYTETHVMSPPSPPSVTETSVHPKPSDLPTYSVSTPIEMTETSTTPRPLSDTNNVCTLIIVIVVLSVLLSVVCFLVGFHRRKRNNKTVMPGCPKGNRNESREEDSSSSRSSQAQAPGRSEKKQNDQWDSETGWRRSFNGVRAKSADAVLFTSPFCAPVRNQVTLQTETEAQPKDRSEGKQKQGSEPEDLTNNTDVNAKQGESCCVSVNTDAVPYLSIGTNQSKPGDFNKQSTDDPEQRSMTRKLRGRISTWPPTAVQWQARCKMMEKGEEEEGSDLFTIWTPKFPGEVKKVFDKMEHPSASDQDKKEDTERNQIEDLLKINVGHCSKPKHMTTSDSEAHVFSDRKQEEELKEEEMIQDPATVKQTISGTQILNQEKFGPRKHTIPAESPAEKNTTKSEPKRAVMSRQRADNRSTQSSKAPSGGASPDDETLLSGNEYAFMDLLHEVAQNNGRWTRDRWKQIHANRQRR